MQGSEAYRLIVRRGPQPNQVFELDEDVINLGRDITNHIVINDREVSRHHLRLMRGNDGYTIEDLGSTNGTFVNGKRVTVFIDGKKVVDYTEPDNPERPDGMKGRLIDRGTFALQGHDPGSTVYYKDIMVKVLPD